MAESRIRTRLVRLVRVRRAGTPKGDPAERLVAHLSEQQALLVTARRSLVDLSVSRRRTELQAGRAEDEARAATERARRAVADGQDEIGRRHLTDAIDAERRRDALRTRFASLDGQVTHLEQRLDLLESQLHHATAQLHDLRADRDAATAALSIQSALGAAGPQADQTAQARDHMRRIQAEAAARDEIAWEDPDSPQVRAAFADLERTIAANQRLITGLDHPPR
ncbi:PspA/IM30 family protein [Occultella aeris]|uniref:PspA/IM30 family protein n=1 Tax=Occultella aeris TaxID=2761496 RepID=A0A7M4DEN0_9MICO|nr:PspA/IM30 family protein [Occultella aeris]VZO35373.1 PspA/IM30 family protein [Occultella aeris]